jgi:hypothetical protein
MSADWWNIPRPAETQFIVFLHRKGALSNFSLQPKLCQQNEPISLMQKGQKRNMAFAKEC